MNERDATQLLPALVWHDPRAHLRDDTWLLTICAILLAVALPWFVSGLRIDFAATAAGLLALGALHVILAAMSGLRPKSQVHLIESGTVIDGTEGRLRNLGPSGEMLADFGVLQGASKRQRHLIKVGVGQPGAFPVAIRLDQAGFVREVVESFAQRGAE